MDKRTTGLYAKFDVRRTDGSDTPGGKHHGCYYFVLDLDHDPHALPALRAYADSCAKDYPALAFDLRAVADGNELIRAKAERRPPGHSADVTIAAKVCSNPEDCCRALTRVWQALGVTSYTGKSVWEHVEELHAKYHELLNQVGEGGDHEQEHP